MKILLPMAGESIHFDRQSFPFPKPLVEINGRLMIEYSIQSLATALPNSDFIFILRHEDQTRFYLDKTLTLLVERLTHRSPKVVIQQGKAKGAVCSCLLAIDFINEDEELIISNYDQYIDCDLKLAVDYFRDQEADAGVICFDSIHPQWSYAKLDPFNKQVCQVTEKEPISRNAIAGFYYFKKGRYFIDAAKNTILKDSSFNGLFYLSQTFNELILNGNKVITYPIDSSKYFSFYSPIKIKELEQSLQKTQIAGSA